MAKLLILITKRFVPYHPSENKPFEYEQCQSRRNSSETDQVRWKELRENGGILTESPERYPLTGNSRLTPDGSSVPYSSNGISSSKSFGIQPHNLKSVGRVIFSLRGSMRRSLIVVIFLNIFRTST